MLSQIKALLSDAQLRQKIKETNSLLEVIALIKSAGAEKGYQFSNDCLYQLLQNQLEPLSETDLLAISGGWSGSPRCLEG